MTEQAESKTFTYIGSELDFFERAVNWKRYWGSRIHRYLGESVLEVGAGIGGTTQILARDHTGQWICMEPDGELIALLQQKRDNGDLPARCEIRKGTVANLAPDELFDSICYIDVMEHIEDDKSEIALAAKHLRPHGHLIVLCPAHQYLFSEFDTEIGHFRRYNRQMMAALTPPELETEALYYLDSVGMFASLGNRLLMRASLPTYRQIWFWDKFMIPASRIVDPLLGRRVGKSVMQVWRRKA
ncbi:MAG: class I SAM-dependent methyltransferase [Anaerolineae bacterium]|nr:class I SAM-dependent methyltransferase [Anaerolineae bacterium]